MSVSSWHSDNPSVCNQEMHLERTNELHELNEHRPSTLKDCSTNDLLVLLKYELKNEKVLLKYQQDLAAFIKEKEINGQILKQMHIRGERREFGKNLIAYYGSKSIHRAAMKTYDFFINYKFNIMKQKKK
eukprot:145584_1